MNWIERQIEWGKSFLSESYKIGVAGKASSRRVIELGVVWAFIFSYVKIAIASATVIDIPTTWGMVILGILGIKVWDRIKNKDISETKP